MATGFILLAVPLLAACIGGVILVIVGLRGRLVAGTLECASCHFALAGSDGSSVCPECGRSLKVAGAIRERRVRRWRLITPGLLLLGLAIVPIAFLGLQMAAGVSLIQAAPVWWLRFELGLATPARAAAIGNELDIRLTGSLRSMTTAEAQAAADDLSAIIADPSRTWNPGWSTFYERARSQNLVSDAHWMQYVERLLVITCTTRTRVRTGAELPISLELSGPQFAESTLPLSMVRVGSTLVQGTVGGKTLSDLGGGMAMLTVHRLGTAGWTTAIPIDVAPGATEVTAQYRFDVTTADGQDRLIGSFVRDFSLPVTVVGADEPAVRVVNDDTRRTAIVASLAIDELRYARDGYVHYTIRVTNAPIDMAFRVLLKPRDGALAGREFEIGSIAFRQASSSGYGGGTKVDGMDATRADIVLRASIETAERSASLESLWMGPDLVIENVNVARSSP